MMISLLHVCFLSFLFSWVFCEKQPPHIIFILADDVGWNDVGYHNEVFKTPNIDSLAKAGVELNNYYTGAVCSPSRFMLMTGRYASTLGMPSNYLGKQPRCLPLDEVTVAEKLKESGYSTHIVGKWHCGLASEKCLPYKRGFDSFFGYLSSAIRQYKHTSPEYDDLWDFRNMTENVGPKYYGQYSTHLFTKEAERVIEQHNPNKPLFLYLAYSSNHARLEVPPRYTRPFESEIHDKHRLILAGMSSCLDEGVGNVISKLKKTGLYDNAVIIFASDNGGSVREAGNNWPLRGVKGTLFEGGVRVPAFVNSPLLKPDVRGTKSNELIHVTDWFPTLLHLAGGYVKGRKQTKPLHGFNQWKTISEGTATQRHEILLNLDKRHVIPLDEDDETVQRFGNDENFNISITAAIRSGKWKLITGDTNGGDWTPPLEMNPKDIPDFYHTPNKTVNLFDIENDPTERHNLALEHPHKVRELLQRLGEHFDDAIEPLDREDPFIEYGVMDGLLGPWVTGPVN